MADPPRGTVAFLFTDIEGSTKLWERDSAAMSEALQRHFAILGAAITAHGGVHFKTIGDAVQAAFPDVPAAARAAVDAQRGLAVEPWTETGPLAVRMALHAGEATPTGGERLDYLAPALNRLARLLAAGHGGQILLSGVARALVASNLPAGVELRDLGQHRLRDLLEPEQIWQVLIPGLPDTFPALKTLEGHAVNLPAQPTPLIGRDALLAELLPIITDPAMRLLTLTGPGGVGKTRLAVQLAANALDAFPNGAYFVDLAAVSGADAVFPEIAETIGVRESGGQTLKEATLALLAPKRLLLVLDNLEQIRPMEELGRALAELLAAAPSLTILATSRAPLRIRAEREWPLDPLAVPDPDRLLPMSLLADNPAVALFMDRAQAARPSLVLTDANAAAIAEIVYQLDGLPLAMELAAARLRALSPKELRDRLGKQLDLLFGSAADRPDRQQTLRATIRWSYDLLSPTEQAIFCRLGIFSGGFTLEAAESIVSELGQTTIDVLGGVEELLVESLLRADEAADGQLRYRMLETIRAYAGERRRESGEEEAARAAHLSYFTRWSKEAAKGLVDDDRLGILDQFENEHANLRAAFGWTLDAGHPEEGLALAGHVWKFWQFRGHFTEGRSWLQRLLAGSSDAPTEERATALEGAGVLAWNQGDLTRAEELLQQAMAISVARGDTSAQARCLNNLGNVRNLMGDLDSAATLFTESLELARTLDNPRHEATTLNNLALISIDRGALDEARAMLEESLALKLRIGARAETAIVLGNLALISWLHQDLRRAIELLEEALAIERETDNPVGIADALGNLAEMLAETGALSRSVALQRESLLIRQEIGDWLSLPYSLDAIGGAAIIAGHVGPAVRLLAASHALREAVNTPIPASDRASYDEIIKRATTALGEETFAALWREGLRLGRDEAVTAALTLCDAIAAGKADDYETALEHDVATATS